MSSRVAALTLIAGLALARPAHAQCISNASSCLNCHETQGLRSVLRGTQPWHVDHGFGDLCVACHAGDPAALTKDAAHLGILQPLVDPPRACTGCHASETTDLAARYRAAMRVQPVPSSLPARPSPSTPVVPVVDRRLACVSALLCVALYWVFRRRHPSTRRRLLAWLRDKTWSPYVAGVLLGLVVALSEVFYGRPIAAAGAFDKLAAYVGRWLFPSSQYYRHVMTPGITWQVWLMVGVLAGSFASSRLSGEARLRWLPDTLWQERFGASRTLRLLVAFFGAVLVQVGAGIAGGCTSGLAISGGAVLAPGAFLFMAGMFASGIPTAWLWHRKRGHGCSTS